MAAKHSSRRNFIKRMSVVGLTVQDYQALRQMQKNGLSQTLKNSAEGSVDMDSPTRHESMLSSSAITSDPLDSQYILSFGTISGIMVNGQNMITAETKDAAELKASEEMNQLRLWNEQVTSGFKCPKVVAIWIKDLFFENTAVQFASSTFC